jgi:hypothetical protein
VIGTTEEELGAEPVTATAAVASAAAAERALVDVTEVPACHLAGRAFAQRVDAERDQVPARGNSNENEQHCEAPIYLTLGAVSGVALRYWAVRDLA